MLTTDDDYSDEVVNYMTPHIVAKLNTMTGQVQMIDCCQWFVASFREHRQRIELAYRGSYAIMTHEEMRRMQLLQGADGPITNCPHCWAPIMIIDLNGYLAYLRIVEVEQDIANLSPDRMRERLSILAKEAVNG